MTRQTRRAVELAAAAYGWWWAANVAVAYLSGANPLWWTGLDYDGGLALVWVMGLGSFMSAIGERINGRWRFSPLLRVLGLALMGAVAAVLALAGIEASATAWANYSALAVLLCLGAVAALGDLDLGDTRDERVA